MLKIYTKQIRNKWFCGSTIDGYDRSFEGNSIIEAQSKMRIFLKGRGKENYAVWEEPVYYVWPVKTPKPPIGYAKNRIDNL